jgi:hypothetical protein
MLNPLRRVQLREHALAGLAQRHHLGQFVAVQLHQTADVPMRHHHQVTVVVGKLVEHDDGPRSEVHDQRLARGGLERRAEDAARRLSAGISHVAESPGGPQAIH